MQFYACPQFSHFILGWHGQTRLSVYSRMFAGLTDKLVSLPCPWHPGWGRRSSFFACMLLRKLGDIQFYGCPQFSMVALIRHRMGERRSPLRLRWKPFFNRIFLICVYPCPSVVPFRFSWKNLFYPYTNREKTDIFAISY